MPSPLFTIQGLMDAFWERSDCPVECLRDQIRDGVRLLVRAEDLLGELKRDGSDGIEAPSVEALLPTLEIELNRPQERPLRRRRGDRPLSGTLLGFPQSKGGRKD